MVLLKFLLSFSPRSRGNQVILFSRKKSDSGKMANVLVRVNSIPKQQLGEFDKNSNILVLPSDRKKVKFPDGKVENARKRIFVAIFVVVFRDSENILHNILEAKLENDTQL